MPKTEPKYDHKKNLLLIIFGIIMIIFFSYLYLNANEISLRKPTNGRYSWVGKLFYKNDELLSIVSIFFIIIFSYSLIIIIKQCFKKNCSGNIGRSENS